MHLNLWVATFATALEACLRMKFAEKTAEPSDGEDQGLVLPEHLDPESMQLLSYRDE